MLLITTCPDELISIELSWQLVHTSLSNCDLRQNPERSAALHKSFLQGASFDKERQIRGKVHTVSNEKSIHTCANIVTRLKERRGNPEHHVGPYGNGIG